MSGIETRCDARLVAANAKTPAEIRKDIMTYQDRIRASFLFIQNHKTITCSIECAIVSEGYRPEAGVEQGEARH